MSKKVIASVNTGSAKCSEMAGGPRSPSASFVNFVSNLGSFAPAKRVVKSESAEFMAVQASAVTATGPQPVLPHVAEQALGKYPVRYIGSTALRRRHTLPMLNWIVTDLLYQSKCDGEELHVKIRNCLRSASDQEDFDRLRTQLTMATHHHGLKVNLHIVELVDGARGGHTTIAFQVSNRADGQLLLRHNFGRVFLFGMFSRESSLFYYIHKDQEDSAAVPTMFVFQATDELQLSEICVKYNDVRPKLNKPNDKHIFLNSYFGKIGQNSNCFEVMHVGSISVSQKRATPSLIDKAAEEFQKLSGENRKSPESKSSGTQSPEEARQHSPPTTVTPPPPQLGTTIPGPSLTLSPMAAGNRRQYRTKRFLVEVIEENEALENAPSPALDTSAEAPGFAAKDTGSSGTTLISNTQSLDNATRASMLKEMDKKGPGEGTKPHVKDIHFGQGLEKVTTKEGLTPPGHFPNRLSLKRSSSGETTLKQDSSTILRQLHTDSLHKDGSRTPNKTMLFIIGQLDICLISTENHKTVYCKNFSNISHCSQGVNHADHFGIIAREPLFTGSSIANTNGSDGYVVHVFKCQTQHIVNELLGSLKQAFNNAYRASKMHHNPASDPATPTTSASSSPLSKWHQNQNLEDFVILNEGAYSTPYCGNCPMNWFHQLSLDIYGLDDETIFALLMHRIQQNSSEKNRNEFYTQILDKIKLDKVNVKVDILMILLKARVERMQRRHEIDGCRMNNMTIFDQIDDDSDADGSNSRSTQSLTRLEGLKMMAKNSFDTLLKRNKPFQSNENIQSASRHDEAVFTRSQSIFSGPSATGSSAEMYQRRNTLAECFPDTDHPTTNIATTPTTAVTATTATQSRLEKSGSFSRTPTQEVNRSLLNLFMKVSGSQTKLNSMEELTQNMHMMDLDSGNGTHKPLATSRHSVAERQISLNAQIRHKLFNKIKRSMLECPLPGNRQVVEMELKTLTSRSLRRKKNYRQLWKFAIHQQMLLNKMNRQNSQNDDDQPPVPRAPYEYEDIPRVDSPQKFQKLSANWDNLIERISSLSDAALFERSATLHEDLVAALRAGIPRQRRGEVWKFLADYRRRVNPPRHSSASKRPSEGLYRSLLGELTVHQHEIFVDLGRTFPNIPYFAATMDRGQLALFNVLKVYSLYDEQVGYCQGLAFVAGVLLIHMNEDDAFDLMCFMLQDCGLRDQYKNDLEDLQAKMYQMSRLLGDYNCPLQSLLDQHNIMPTLYCSSAFMTLFASQFPVNFVSRVFDFLIFYGSDAIFTIFFVLLDRISDQVLQCADFESISEVLRNQINQLSIGEMERVFDKASKYSFHKELEQYKVEYKVIQEEFVHLSMVKNSKHDNVDCEQQNGKGEPQQEISQLSREGSQKRFESLERQNRQLTKQNLELVEQVKRLEERLRAEKRNSQRQQNEIQELKNKHGPHYSATRVDRIPASDTRT